jgi:hypothetical protein
MKLVSEGGGTTARLHRVRMEPFDLPLLCGALFVALLLCVVWGPEWLLLRVSDKAFAYGLSALLTTMVVSLIWAGAEQVRNSVIRRILHWIIAIPTLLADLFLVLLMVAPAQPGADDELGLAMLPIFGIIAGGLAALLLIAFFPTRAAAPADRMA